MNAPTTAASSPAPLPDDPRDVAPQLQTLDVLRRAQQEANAFLGRFGKLMGASPVAFIGLKLLGLALDGESASLFVRRLARLPWWVAITLCIAGGFLAFVSLRLAKRPSAVLDHLQRNPQDPFVDVAARVEVRQAYRALLLAFRTRAGLILEATVPGRFEDEALAAIRQANLPIVPW